MALKNLISCIRGAGRSTEEQIDQSTCQDSNAAQLAATVSERPPERQTIVAGSYDVARLPRHKRIGSPPGDG